MVALEMLHVHRAERADGLVDALAALLGEPSGDPFAAEVVAVPTRGMERWLTQRLSAGLGAQAGRQDGVCANVDFPSPRRLTEEAVAVAAGIAPEADAWLPERLVWPLLEVVDGALHEPWLQSLAAHLGATLDTRSEEHTSELQSPDHLVCRLLLEKKKNDRGNTRECTNTRNSSR